MTNADVLGGSNNGVKVPQIGFGTWQAKAGEVRVYVYEAETTATLQLN